MAGNPEETSIIAILIGTTGTPLPEPDKEVGADMKAFNFRSEDPFGQDLTPC